MAFEGPWSDARGAERSMLDLIINLPFILRFHVVVRVTTHNNPVLNHDQLLMFLCQNLRRSGGNRVYKIVFWIMVQEYRVGGRYDGRGGELTT